MKNFILFTYCHLLIWMSAFDKGLNFLFLSPDFIEKVYFVCESRIACAWKKYLWDF